MITTKIKSTIKLFNKVALLVIVASAIINSIGSITANAASPIDYSPYNQARIYNAKNMLIYCLVDLKEGKTFTQDEIKKGSFFSNTSEQLGYFFDETDGVIRCNNELSKILNNGLIKSDSQSIFEFFFNELKVFTQVGTNDAFEYSADLGNSPNERLKNIASKINNKFKEKYPWTGETSFLEDVITKATNDKKTLIGYKGTNQDAEIRPSSTEPLTFGAAYFMLKPSFERSCPYSIASPGIVSNNYRIVNEATGEIKDEKILFQEQKIKDVKVFFGWGLPPTGDAKLSIRPGSMTCIQALNLLNSYSDVASGDTKRFINDGGLISFIETGAKVEKPTCESSIRDIGWIVCQILRPVDKLIQVAEETIMDKFKVDIDPVKDNKDLESIWNNVARLASGLLVIVALVMIISTTLGFGFVSTYTVKKVLPRLVLGAIGIWLSWTLVTTYIDIMNTIGGGLQEFMYLAVSNSKEFSLGEFLGTIARLQAKDNALTIPASGVLFTTVSIYAISTVGTVGILSGALTALIGLLIGLVVLAIRELLLIVLLIFSPLAFASWILPSTKTYWSKWSSLLNKLLIMYPLFAALFATGKILGRIYTDLLVANANTNTDTNNINILADVNIFSFIIPIVAYIFPFFYLPKLFKKAGEALGGITGAVSKVGNRVTGGWQNTLKGASKARGERRDSIKAESQRQRQLTGQIAGITVPGLRGLARYNNNVRKGRSSIPTPLQSRKNRAANAQASGREALEAVQSSQKILAQFSSDKEIIKAIAYGGVANIPGISQIERQQIQTRMESSGAIKYINDVDAQRAATIIAAGNGDADREMLQRLVTTTIQQDDINTANNLLAGATGGAKAKGDLATGLLKLDNSTGLIGYKDTRGTIQSDHLQQNFITAKNDAIVNELAGMNPDDRVAALSKIEFDSASSHWMIKDKDIREALLNTPNGYALISDILSDRNHRTTAALRDALFSIRSQSPHSPQGPQSPTPQGPTAGPQSPTPQGPQGPQSPTPQGPTAGPQSPTPQGPTAGPPVPGGPGYGVSNPPTVNGGNGNGTAAP